MDFDTPHRVLTFSYIVCVRLLLALQSPSLYQHFAFTHEHKNKQKSNKFSLRIFFFDHFEKKAQREILGNKREKKESYAFVSGNLRKLIKQIAV